MSELLLAVDVGSNSCKAAVFDPTGKSVRLGCRPFETNLPKAGWAEIEPRSLWEAFVSSIRDALHDVDAHAIRAIGISAQLGLVAVAGDGSPISKILPWMDRRARTQAIQLSESLGDERIYRTTGRRCDPEWPACKILWLKQNHPDRFAKTHKFLTLKDFLIQQLTGEFYTDYVHASYSMLFDVERRGWDQGLLGELGLDVAQLPQPVDATEIVGELTRRRAGELGLKTLPVVSGGPDGSVGALGAGLLGEGRAVNVVGTTDVLLACGDRPVFDPAMRTLVNCYVLPGKWTHGGPLSLTGGCLKWFCDNFAEDEAEIASRLGLRIYDWFDRKALQLHPGSDGLLFIPSLVGERTPGWNPSARGVAFGITLAHQKVHFYRAILEGSAFMLKNATDALQEQGMNFSKLILVGGGAKSGLWASIRADVLGVPVIVPSVEEATLLGASLIAGVGSGVHADFSEAISHTSGTSTEWEPDEEKHQVYQEIHRQFRRLQDSCAGSAQDFP